ncbi:MAG: SUMF1/EgtB/PvdO family nonheme iron enzyme [Bacteroidia bacterium]|nr:SUMF1/EgtB/PvdO family nonheme iron enzyme [Bacteroidia bacterium]
MKKNIFIFSICVVSILLFINARVMLPEKFTIKDIEKTLGKINDTLYVSKYEVSNLQYKAFLSELKKTKNAEKYNASKIDTVGWLEPTIRNEPMVVLYHKHPVYDKYPVVNISYDGAQNFCEWLTEKYNSSPDKKFKKVKFRLPAEKEWVFAAKGGSKDQEIYSWGNNNLKNAQGKKFCNYLEIGDEFIHKDKTKGEYVIEKKSGLGSVKTLGETYDITAPVDAFLPNGYGLFNLSGNVAEMIAEKGKTKGGSWRSSGYDVRIDLTDTYEKSSVEIGFRCVMVVLEK